MSGERAIEVRTPHGAYPLFIEAGALDAVADRCAEHAPAHRYAVIADSQVARLYGARVVESFSAAGAEAVLITFPAGEWNKTREQWAGLSDRMLAAGFGRDTAVIALGGGVTGDLAGFVAATFMRGVPVVQVPTTLLAMLDSSVGGKTGVDTDAGKNLVGAFHHPAAVLIDPAVLGTLPRHQRCAGLAEAVKTAAILDEGLWERMEAECTSLAGGDAEALAALVADVVAHKARVVEVDPSESGLRAVLNFGHTVGHAIESLEGYTVLHGEAVAAGMRVEARLGEALGVTESGTAQRIADLLAGCELDREWEGERRADELREAMTRDKKGRRDRIRCVLLRRIGHVATDSGGAYTFALGSEALGAPFEGALRPASEA